ncbi:MAG: PilZ domain-containing protein [Bdellovibrionales bacterium]
MSLKDFKNADEQRRFPRVPLHRELSELLQVLGAQLTWPNLEVSRVLDLSYKGVAVERPGLYPLAAHAQLEVELKLGAQSPFRVLARIAWFSLDVVGLELRTLPAEGHLAMAEYLDVKLAGLGLKAVERAFFSPRHSFQHWFQRPGGLNVFVWREEGCQRINRVVVEWDEATVEFERGKSPGGFEPDRRRALLVLSQMDKPDLPMEEFVRSFRRGEPD